MIDIRDYEAMAKLEFSEDERQWASARAGALTESFRELESIDTNGADSLFTVLDITNVLREDESSKMLCRDELLSNAPEQYDGYFQVPKTLE